MHYFINYRLEFVSQISAAIHTNTIEGLWSQVKKEVKRTESYNKISITYC